MTVNSSAGSPLGRHRARHGGQKVKVYRPECRPTGKKIEMITADDATDTARSEGVPHMSENHRGNGNYFEQMDGARADVNKG